MNKQLWDEMEEDSKGVNLPNDETLKRIGDLAISQGVIERQIVETEEKLKSLNQKLDEIRDKSLPDLLMSHGITELKLTDGHKVKINKMVYASIKAETKPECITWLEDNGFGGLIKYKAEVDIGRGETELKEGVKKALTDLGVDFTEKTDVHPQTLKAFVSEQLDSGIALPENLFSIHTVNRCKIS